MNRSWVFLLVGLGLATLLYAPALTIGFLSDDYEALSVARSPEVFSTIWTQPLGGHVYRPLGFMSLWLDFRFWGESAVGWHLSSVLLHGLNAFLLYQLIRRWVGQRIGSAASLVFLFYPSHVEAVAWVSGRFDVLATTLVLAAGIAFEHALRKSNPALWLSLLFATAAYLTKESSFVLVGLLALRVFMDQRFRTIRTLLQYVLPHLLILAVILALRRFVVGAWIGGYSVFGVSVASAFSWTDLRTFSLAPYGIITRLINLPFLQTRLPALGFLQSPAVTWLMVTAACGVLVLALRRIPRIVFIGLASVGIALVPVAPLLKTVSRTLESTRFWYLPSLAISVMLGYLLMTPRRRTVQRIVMVAVLFGFGSFLMINLRPWKAAGNEASALRSNFAELASSFDQDPYLFFRGIPDNYFGAYVFRRGWGEYLDQTYHGRFSQRVAIGRSFEPAFDTCDEAQAAAKRAVVLDWSSDIQEFQPRPELQTQLLAQFDENRHTSSRVDSWSETRALPEHSAEWKPVHFSVENTPVGLILTPDGGPPQLSTDGGGLNPADIGSVLLEITAVASRRIIPVSLYWSSENEGFHEYQRHLFFALTADGQRHEQIVRFCQFPAWGLSQPLRSIRLQFPADLRQLIIHQLTFLAS